MLATVAMAVPMEKLAVHFHIPTARRWQNLYAAMELGVATIDSSVAGLGGCPYTQGPLGNVATRDVGVHAQRPGDRNGVDLRPFVRRRALHLRATRAEPAPRSRGHAARTT